MSLKSIVAINLKYYRYKENLSQEKFYSKYNLSTKYLASVERGEINFTVDFLDNLAKTLNVNVNDLITYKVEHIINKKRIDNKNED